MKILVLNYEYPPLGGGAGVITREISERLAQSGHRVTVLTTWFDGTPEVDVQGNLTIIRLKSRRKYTYRCSVSEMVSWIMYSKRFLKGYCKKNSFDVCLANFSLPGGEVALYISKRFFIPYLVLSHGHDIPWMFVKEMFVYHLITFFRIKTICSRSAYNILLTAAMKKNADRFLGAIRAEKNIIIPNACDFDFFKPNTTQRTPYFKMLFAGRLVSQKDPFTFLKALKLLAKEKIPFKACIVGDGPMRKKMELFVKKNSLGNHIVFTGWLSKDGILEEYGSASIYVQTSRYEAMSLSPLEALACGTYVVCTPVGGNKDIIFDNVNGEFFSVGNAEELAEKLICFYNEKFKNGFVVNNSLIDKVRSSYSWDIIISKYIEIVKQTACQ